MLRNRIEDISLIQHELSEVIDTKIQAAVTTCSTPALERGVTDGKIKEIEEERAADEKLSAAKQIVKDMNSAYTSAIKYEKAKISFLLEKTQEIQDGTVNPTSSLAG